MHALACEVLPKNESRTPRVCLLGGCYSTHCHALTLVPTCHCAPRVACSMGAIVPSELRAAGVLWHMLPCASTRRWAPSRWVLDVSFSCVVKTQRRWSNKIYKTELTKTRYNNQVLGKYRVDPQRAGLTLITNLTWSNLGLKEVLNKRKQDVMNKK